MSDTVRKENNILVQVNPNSSTPIYAQIIEQIKYSIANSSLKEGAQLPSVRELAYQLKVNPNTIAKAYRELEHEGVIHIKQGSGAFVTEKGHIIRKQERIRIIMEKIDQLIVEGFHLGIEEEELKQFLSEKLKTFKNRRK